MDHIPICGGMRNEMKAAIVPHLGADGSIEGATRKPRFLEKAARNLAKDAAQPRVLLTRK
jgi:hypothetical protein